MENWKKNMALQYICKHTLHKKMKFSIKDFLSKYDQIRSFLRISSHLLKKPLMENFIFVQEYTLQNWFKVTVMPTYHCESFKSHQAEQRCHNIVTASDLHLHNIRKMKGVDVVIPSLLNLCTTLSKRWSNITRTL